MLSLRIKLSAFLPTLRVMVSDKSSKQMLTVALPGLRALISPVSVIEATVVLDTEYVNAPAYSPLEIFGFNLEYLSPT